MIYTILFLGNPDLHHGLLAPQEREIGVRRGLRPESAIIEVLAAILNEGTTKQLVVKEITKLVNVLLRAKGEVIEYSPEEIGHCLKRLGLFTRRVTGGRGLRLDREARLLVYDLVSRYGVAVSAVPRDDRETQVTDSKLFV